MNALACRVPALMHFRLPRTTVWGSGRIDPLLMMTQVDVSRTFPPSNAAGIGDPFMAGLTVPTMSYSQFTLDDILPGYVIHAVCVHPRVLRCLLFVCRNVNLEVPVRSHVASLLT